MKTDVKVNTSADLGDAKRFPRELAPCDAETIRVWVIETLNHGDARRQGVPLAFSRGVLLGCADAFSAFATAAADQGDTENAVAAACDVLAKVFGPAAVEVTKAVVAEGKGG